MRYAVLGGTGLRVSVVGLAVYAPGRGPFVGLGRRDVAGLVGEARRLGVNFFVSAPVYGRGALEALREGLGGDFEGVVVGLLVGYREGGGQSFEPEFLVGEVEAACDVLGHCPVELVFLHEPGLDVLRRPEVYEAASALVEEGLALHVGVSLGADVDAVASAREALRREVVEVLRFPYSMVEQEPGGTLARMARERGRGVVVSMPHAGGLLLGESGMPEWDRLEPYYAGGKRMRGWYRSALALYEFMKSELREELAEVLESMTPAQLALRFVYSSIPVDSVEVVVRSVAKLRELVEAAERPELPGRLVERIRGVYAKKMGLGV